MHAKTKRCLPGLSRRELIAGAATLAGVAALPGASRALAQTLTAGEAEIFVVSDGTMTLPVGFSYGDVAADEVGKLLSEAGMPTDAITNGCNVTVMRRGDRVAIFDVGAGPNFLPTTGKLLENLAAAGIDPAEVTDVVFTHAHPDHLWGLTDDFDELVFADAAYHIAQAEWDFWMSPDAIDALPEERKNFAVGAQNRLPTIEDRISFFKGGAEVLPGVEAMDTAGHTPGHTSFLIHGGSSPLVLTGDAVTNVVVSLARPDWPSGADQDPKKGAATRKALLDRIAADRAQMVGFHFPHPGAGTIEAKGAGYRFVAA